MGQAKRRKLATATMPLPRDVPIPMRMAHLPRDPRGYPVPWIVLRSGGRPHFTVNDEVRRIRTLTDDLCPVCGGKLERQRWFVGGPRSAFDPNGAYFDTPMHDECMRYALRVCPYLAAPNYEKRIDAATVTTPADQMIFVDHTQIPARPVLFVAGLTDGQIVHHPQRYVIPKRPFLAVEYWLHGRQLDDDDGARRVQEALAVTMPERQDPRLVIPAGRRRP